MTKGYAVRLATVCTAWQVWMEGPMPTTVPYHKLWEQVRAQAGDQVAYSYHLGWEAGAQNKPADANPHPAGSNRDAWSAGYDDAREWYA